MSKPFFEEEKPVKNTPSKIVSPDEKKAQRQHRENKFIEAFVASEDATEARKKPWWKI